MRKAFLWLHRWLGLAAGLIISFLGLTGSALVFRHELEAKIEPRLVHVQEQSQRVTWQTVYNNVQRAYPDAKINHFFLGRTPTTSHEIWLDGGERYAYVNPYTGEVLGDRSQAGGVLPWLFQAHTHLVAGETGEKIAGWSGLTLVALSISGLLLWLPRRPWKAAGWRNAFKLHWKKSWKVRNYELHRVGGALIACFLLLSSITGVAMVWPEVTESIVSTFAGKTTRPKPKATQSARTLPLDVLVAKANAAFPDAELRRISFPAKPGAPLVIRKKRASDLHPNGMNYIYLDATTGQVLAIDDASKASLGTRIMNARYPIHIGLWGGTTTRVLAVFVGLSPLLLFVSGFIIWNGKRNRDERIAKSRLSGK